jgi:predicted nucleic acid-binding protein
MKTEKKKLNVYLDNCCYNRPYDDQAQLRVELETKAKLFIQNLIVEGKVNLTISYVSEYENEFNPFPDRKSGISDFFHNASINVEETQAVKDLANELRTHGLKTKDALHISCAIEARCDYFFTTDDRILKHRDDRTAIMKPTDFIDIWEDNSDDE